MAEDHFAPYAPTKAVLAVFDRFRGPGLPDPVTNATLERIGIPSSNAPRTLQALRFLKLIDEGGNRLPAFNGLRQAKTEEYPGQLAEIVRAAYLPIFEIVDPATDSEVAISDAFRGYEPASTREKMVSLFMGLCRAAGIVTDKPVRRSPSTPRRPSAPRSTTKQREGGGKPVVEHSAPAPQTPELLFGVTVEDIAALPSEEFDAVWAALGKVAKARATATRDTARLQAAIAASRDEEDEEEG